MIFNNKDLFLDVGKNENGWMYIFSTYKIYEKNLTQENKLTLKTAIDDFTKKANR